MRRSFIETVLKINRPNSASMADWDRWDETLRTTRPVAYWLTERLPRMVYRLHSRTFGRISRLRHYLMNGLVSKTHALTSTSLKFGVWHDLDSRILHCTMDSLVSFIEVDMAGLWQAGKGKKVERSAADGLAYLDWACSLSVSEFNNEDKGGTPTDEPSEQALDAREIRRVYIWWTIERLKRIDPSEESGLDQFCESMDLKYPRLPNSTGGLSRRTWHHHYDNSPVLTKEEDETYGLLIKKTMAIETARDNEDEEMLISVIKKRKSLWT